MSTRSRNGFKWTVNEIISLQREFELLNWDIDTIAAKHKRSARAIMFKLDQEGFADYNKLYYNYQKTLSSDTSATSLPQVNNEDDNEDEDNDYFENEDNEEDENDEDEDDTLSDRVCVLETSILEVRDMLQKMMTLLSNSPKSKCLF